MDGQETCYDDARYRQLLAKAVDEARRLELIEIIGSPVYRLRKAPLLQRCISMLAFCPGFTYLGRVPRVRRIHPKSESDKAFL